MNAIKLTGIVAAGALLASSAAIAGPKWTFVEGTYIQGSEVNIGGGSGETDNDAYTLGGSFGFAEKYHVDARYIDGTLGVPDPNNPGNALNTDYDGYSFGIGVNPAITDDTDFVTNIFYTDLDFDTIGNCGSCLDTDGYGAKVGLRSMIADNLEMSAYGVYVDYDIDGLTNGSTALSGIQTGAQIGGQYYWTENFSIGLDALIADETDLEFSARWSF